MGLPTKRHTSSQVKRRRGNIKLRAFSLSLCSRCGKSKLPHRACLNCGYYKGREVVNVIAKSKVKHI